MNKISLFALGLVGLMMVGCGSKQSVEGDWKVTGLQPGQIPVGTSMSFTMNFKSPAAKLSIKGNSEAMGQKFDLDVTAPASYAVEGDRLKLTFTDFVINTSNPAVMTFINAGLAKQKDQVIQSMNANASGKITWSGNDKFMIESPTGTVTFDRVVLK
jgi:hypothetical protein